MPTHDSAQGTESVSTQIAQFSQEQGIPRLLEFLGGLTAEMRRIADAVERLAPEERKPSRTRTSREFESEALAALIQFGPNMTTIAEALGCSTKTVRRFRDENQRFREALTSAKVGHGHIRRGRKNLETGFIEAEADPDPEFYE